MANESSVASQLRQARQEQDKTLDEAQKGCGVSLNVLVDLESGTCDVVEPVFARFALRTYAQYLGLDVEALEKLFDVQFGSRPRQYQAPQNPTAIPVDKPAWPARLPHLGLVLVIIIIVLGAISLIYWQMESDAGQTDQADRFLNRQSKSDTTVSLAVGQP